MWLSAFEPRWAGAGRGSSATRRMPSTHVWRAAAIRMAQSFSPAVGRDAGPGGHGATLLTGGSGYRNSGSLGPPCRGAAGERPGLGTGRKGKIVATLLPGATFGVPTRTRLTLTPSPRQ